MCRVANLFWMAAKSTRPSVMLAQKVVRASDADVDNDPGRGRNSEIRYLHLPVTCISEWVVGRKIAVRGPRY